MNSRREDVRRKGRIGMPLRPKQAVGHTKPADSHVNELWQIEGGYLQPPKHIERFCHLHPDGTFFVDAAGRGNPEIQQYIARAREMAASGRAGAIKVQYVDQDTLATEKRESRHARKLDSDRMDQAKGLIQAGVKVRASDIHIYIKRDYALVRFRIDGVLRDHSKIDREEARDLLRCIYEAMCDVKDKAYYESRRQDGRIGLTERLPTGVHGVRVATAPTDVGNIMVMRILYADLGHEVGQIHGDYTALGYTKRQHGMIRKMQSRAHGINVVAGVTGSGKSTLLKYVMEDIAEKRPGYHPLSVEDPPEYSMDPVNQIPITNATGDAAREEAYNDAVRGTLRLDPDVAMIGEIRDLGTLLAAIRLAQTGQKVWATTHADDALLVFSRFFAMGVEREFLLDSSVFSGLISQRLVPILCPKCKIPYSEAKQRLPEEVAGRLEVLSSLPSGRSVEHLRLRNPDGCPNCRKRIPGIQGRTVVAETIDVNQELLDLVGQGVPVARKYWMEEQKGLTLTAHAARKVFDGLVDPVDAEDIAGFFEGERMMNIWDPEA